MYKLRVREISGIFRFFSDSCVQCMVWLVLVVAVGRGPGWPELLAAGASRELKTGCCELNRAERERGESGHWLGLQS